MASSERCAHQQSAQLDCLQKCLTLAPLPGHEDALAIAATKRLGCDHRRLPKALHCNVPESLRFTQKQPDCLPIGSTFDGVREPQVVVPTVDPRLVTTYRLRKEWVCGDYGVIAQKTFLKLAYFVEIRAARRFT